MRRDARPHRPVVAEHDALLGRLAEDAHVRDPAVGRQVAAAGGVAAVFAAAKLLAPLCLLDLADDRRDHDVAAQAKPCILDRPHRLDIAGERALHVRDAQAPDVPVADDRLGLEARLGAQMRLTPRVGGVHVAVEHQARAAAGALEPADDVGTPVLDLLPADRRGPSPRACRACTPPSAARCRWGSRCRRTSSPSPRAGPRCTAGTRFWLIDPGGVGPRWRTARSGARGPRPRARASRACSPLRGRTRSPRCNPRACPRSACTSRGSRR